MKDVAILQYERLGTDTCWPQKKRSETRESNEGSRRVKIRLAPAAMSIYFLAVLVALKFYHHMQRKIEAIQF